MEEKLKRILEAVAFELGTGRELLISVKGDELMDMSSTVQKFAKIPNAQHSSNTIRGIGGNITTYSFMGNTIHLKIDSELK
jgi:hypothetical protein